MKTALIFPGQGSQNVGMGQDFYQKYESSRYIYKKLDETLKVKMSDLIFNGEETELSRTQNSQPAIMATSIAILSAIRSENILSNANFQCVAGHSLGEYSALVANDSLSFENAVKLLKIRSKAMQDSMPIGTSGMVALIGSSDELVKNCLDTANKYGKIFIANDNAPGQTVLSGEISAIDYVVNNYKNLKIKKAIMLPVSASFHCELMNNASNIMKKEISDYQFNKFTVPLYSNVTANACQEEVIKDLLVRQITARVRWREIVENMISDGIQNFIEIGPGSALSNMVKRISKVTTSISISKLEDLDKLANINL